MCTNDRFSLDIRPGSPAHVRAEEIWARVIEREEMFWPHEEDENTALI